MPVASSGISDGLEGLGRYIWAYGSGSAGGSNID